MLKHSQRTLISLYCYLTRGYIFMSASYSSNTDDLIAEQAADWCMRLHEGSCTAAELDTFDAWLKSDPQHAAEYEKMAEIWDLSAQIDPVISMAMESAADKIVHLPIAEPIPEPQLQSPPQLHPESQQPSSWSLLAKAAAVALFALPVTGYVGWSMDILPNNYRSYTAEINSQDITLPDGSQVTLNQHTSISFINYRHQRLVNFSQGEAFFDVAHDKQHPFVIDTGLGTITVTGTSFNVWKHNANVVVALTEGSVKVSTDFSENNLVPGQQAKFGASQPQIKVSSFNTEKALAWQKGLLILDNATLAEAAPKISRYLQTPLRLSNFEVSQLRIGGVFHTQNIKDMLEDLPKILPVQLTHLDDGSIEISGRKK